MKFILLVLALIQICCVEPRYVLVPQCQCVYTQLRPEFHDENISYQRKYYPGHYEEDLEIDTLLYEDEDHEVRHRRSVIYEDSHHHSDDHVHGEIHIGKRYIEDWEDEEDEEDGKLAGELNNYEVESSDEGGEAVSMEGDLNLSNIVSQVDEKSIDKEKNGETKGEQNTEVMRPVSDGIYLDNRTAKTKNKRSIDDQQFRYQYRPSNQGYCSVLDRYSEIGNGLGQHTDDCTISKNLFFGCDKELENENKKETQRKARKVLKTLTQKINELKVKNDKLKNEAKLNKSKDAKKVSKLENKLKKDVSDRLRNKRKNREESEIRELEGEGTSCACGLYDRNGVCSCQMQNYYNPIPAPVYYTNPAMQRVSSYPVQRVYRQYAPPMPFHVYHRR
ncbi:uncharacterized protein LOC111055970 [Nilaparvata lugens]|uniref:uncharacterized protein LOC111055970 n=1 Tax=Nilaparvata lugens TaxID=108931 RepID=UPI000B98363C|nr:uncharacterized protein LOC111055970 [Nilaparvata lugens]